MYFIYDCNNQIVGNPKGYSTFKGAEQQQNSTYGKAYREIWEAYYKKVDNADNRISSILLIE